MAADVPNELRTFLPRRQDELLRAVSQLRERLAPKAKEQAEVTRLMDTLQVKPLKPPPQVAPPQLPREPSLEEFLRRRHWDLSNEISAITATLMPREKELAEVQQAMDYLGIAGTVRVDDLSGDVIVTVEVEPPTIKQMIISALTDHFHEGASPVELRDFMSMTLGRDVDRNSISPQLARLREQGVVEQVPGNEGKWKLALRGVSAEELVAIGHWPPGAEHAPRTDQTEQPSGVKRRKVRSNEREV